MDQSVAPKGLTQALITSMTLGELPELDAAGQAALEQAFATLDSYRGATVARAFIEWQRRGQVRRDPRGPSVRITDERSSPPPHRAGRPFRTGSF